MRCWSISGSCVAPLRLGGLRGKQSTPSVWLGGTGELCTVGKQERQGARDTTRSAGRLRSGRVAKVWFNSGKIVLKGLVKLSWCLAVNEKELDAGNLFYKWLAPSWFWRFVCLNGYWAKMSITGYLRKFIFKPGYLLTVEIIGPDCSFILAVRFSSGNAFLVCDPHGWMSWVLHFVLGPEWSFC